MPPPAAAPVGAAQKAAERMAQENASMKREAIEQEERLKRLHAKIQKMEQDMAGLLRKRGAVAHGAAASAVAKGARDEETERLEALIRERRFQADAMNKQLLIIKHTSPGAAARKPLSSIYSAHGSKTSISAYGPPAPARRPHSAAGAKKKTGSTSALISDTSEGELREIINALKHECSLASDRLAAAKREVEKKTTGGEMSDKALEARSVDELRNLVLDIKSKTTMLEASEEQRVLALRQMKSSVERTEPMVHRFRDELADLKRALADLTHQKKLVELRKGEHDEVTAEITKLRVQQGELEEENRQLRAVAFGASEIFATVAVLGNEQEELSEENELNRKYLNDLFQLNSASEKALADLETDAPNSISKLQVQSKEDAAKAKMLARDIENLREKLSTFVGHEGEDGGQMDHSAVREARLLAQRMGVPMYMRGARGAADGDDNLDDLRREIRRLKVLQASEVREIGKLRQMLHMQEHLMRHTVAGGAEFEKDLARTRRAHDNKVKALQRRISEIENKNQRLHQLLQASRVDKSASAAADAGAGALARIPSTVDEAMLHQSQLAAGRCVVSVLVEGLVLNKEHADFGRSEPTTLLILDFYLHDIQHSSPMRGVAPDGKLQRELEVSLDDLFLHYLYYDCLQLQLVLVRGLDFDAVGHASLALRPLLENASSAAHSTRMCARLELSVAEEAAGGAGAVQRQPSAAARPVAHVDISVVVHARFAERAREFISRQQAATSTPTTLQRRPSAATDKQEQTQLLEEFPRHVGCTYVLVIKLISISDIASMSSRRSEGSGSRARRRFVGMHQLLDFPVSDTDVISVVEGSQASLFSAGAAPYKIPASPEWDRRLLAGRLELVLLDQSDPSDDVVGTADLMLAPLISRRGIAGMVPLYDAGGKVSAQMAVEVAWEPEPLVEMSRGMSAREVKSVEERLAVIRTWIMHLGLGDLRPATEALYGSWMRKHSAIEAEGISRTEWVAILRGVRETAAKEAAVQGASLKGITEAEMMAIFHHIAGQDGGKMKKEQLVEAIAHPTGVASEHSDQGGRLRGAAARSSAPSSVSSHAAASLSGDRGAADAAAHTGEGGAVTRGGSGEVSDGQAVRLKVEAVTCLAVLVSAFQQCKECAITARCLGGKLQSRTRTQISQPFDNSAVAGGFVAWNAEWGRRAGEREAIRQALQDKDAEPEDVCLEIELCRVSGIAPGAAALPEPLTDLVLGIWRLPLKDLEISRDLKSHAATIKAVAALGEIEVGDKIAEVTIDVSGAALVASLLLPPKAP